MHRPLAVALAAGLALLAGVTLWSRPAEARADGVVDLARCASGFLGSLRPEQLSAAQKPLADPERTQWHFVPGRYAGVELGALDGPQRQRAHELLAAMTSADGLRKAEAIAALEAVLRRIETQQGLDASHRDPDRYSMLVFGEPKPDGDFVVRFQGHHVSLQTVVAGGRVVGLTPQFLGSNPHEVPAASGGGRILGAEEDLARAFLLLLDPGQRTRAVIAAEAPKDILLGPGVAPAALGERRGVPWRDLTEVQRGVLWRLVEEFARVHRGEFAEVELARLRADRLDELSFAWAGGLERGQGHYYRIHGPTFVIELDNTQNNANHVHSMWRSLSGDFNIPREPAK